MPNKIIYYFTFSSLVNALTAIALSIFVYRKDKKSIINRTFGIFGCYLTMWSLAYVIWTLTTTKSESLFWIRALHIGAILIPVGIFHFNWSYLERKNIWPIVLGYLIAAFFLSFSFSKYFVLDVKPISIFPFYGVPGILYPLFLTMFFGYILYPLYLLFIEYKSCKNEIRKIQSLILLIGFIIGVISGGTNFFLYYNIEIPPYLNPLVSVFFILASYSIIKHQLFDIKVAIKKTLVFTGIFGAVYAAFAAFVFLGQVNFKYLYNIISVSYFSKYSILPLIVGTWSLCIGTFVLLMNKKSIVNRTFALEAICCSIWLFSYAAAYMVKNESVALIATKSVYVGVIFIPTLFWHFTSSFLRQVGHLKRRSQELIIPYSISIIALILLLSTKLILSGTYPYYWGYYGKAGVAHNYFLIFFVCAWFYNIIRLYFAYKNESSQIISNRIKYAFFSFFVASPGMLDFIQNYGYEFYPLFSIFVGFGLTILAYAIVRHRLMGIDVVIKKTLVFTGIFAAVFVLFTFFAFIGQETFRFVFGGNKLSTLIFTVMIVVLMYRPLKKFLINATDRFLFQKRYNYKELLKTYTQDVMMVLEMDRLVNLTVSKLSEIIRIENSAIVLMDESGKFTIQAQKDLRIDSFEAKEQDALVSYITGAGGYVIRTQKGDFRLPAYVQDLMVTLNAELIVPLVINDKLIGILSLGKKKSDEPYTQDDIDILLPLARTLSIAISNARLFDQLSKTQAEAAQKDKMATIGTLAAGIAHEIRNPITTIKTFSEFLASKKDDPDFMAKFNRIIPKEIDRINHIIDHLLEFARPGNTVAREAVDLKEELEDVLELVKSEMKLEDIEFMPSINDVPKVSGNKKLIQEVLFNLLQNAIHSVKKGGTIKVSLEVEKDNVVLAIEDNGCGIAEEHIGRIFDPFFTTKDDAKRFGLGLYIVKQIMDRIGGKIMVSSKVGEGTLFRLEFPVQS